MIPPVVISPPFGNYISLRDAVSVAGSFTAEPRQGLIRNTIKSFRKVEGGWVNKIGLRNPGIRHIDFYPDKIYSVAPLVNWDYSTFYHHIPGDMMVELNLGCPNVEEQASEDLQALRVAFRTFVKKFRLVTVKLPPIPHGMTLLGIAYQQGVRHFHMCNTVPCERGGISGAQLRPHSLEAIRWTRRHMPSDITIIGGGGIYKPEHVDLYREAGADCFSLSTVFMTPWRVRSILERIRNGVD